MSIFISFWSGKISRKLLCSEPCLNRVIKIFWLSRRSKIRNNSSKSFYELCKFRLCKIIWDFPFGNMLIHLYELLSIPIRIFIKLDAKSAKIIKFGHLQIPCHSHTSYSCAEIFSKYIFCFFWSPKLDRSICINIIEKPVRIDEVRCFCIGYSKILGNILSWIKIVTSKPSGIISPVYLFFLYFMSIDSKRGESFPNLHKSIWSESAC